MISSLKQLNKILIKNVILSKHIDHASIYTSLKRYVGNDWHKIHFIQNNKYEEYSESFLFSNKWINTQLYQNIIENKQTYDNSLMLKIIKWHPNYNGHFHNHNDHYCYFKVLSGHLYETLNNQNIITNKYYTPHSIGYISNNIEQHKIKNLLNDNSYSLHVYFKNNRP